MFNIDIENINLEKTYDLIVLGGGPTAIGCAIYAARFAMDVLIVGKTFGGLIATTHLVEKQFLQTANFFANIHLDDWKTNQFENFLFVWPVKFAQILHNSPALIYHYF